MARKDSIAFSGGFRVRYPDDERPRLDLADALFTVTRRWPAAWKAADHHLTATSAVRCFRQRSRFLTVQDVADTLFASQSSASRAVDRAVDWRFLTKGPARIDRRSVAVQLMDEGSTYLYDLIHDERAWLADATRGWADGDRIAITHLLLELAEGLRRTSPPPV